MHFLNPTVFNLVT